MSLAAKDLGEENIIRAIPAGKILEIWPAVSSMLHPAVERSHGRWTMPSLLSALKNGSQQLWIIYEENEPIKGVATTEILSYPNRKMLAVQYLGGNGLNTWGLAILDVFQKFAKATGCSGIEATARKGFWKWFKEHGYEDAYTVFEKRIDE